MFDKKKEFNKAAREGRESLNEFFKKIKKLESLEKKKSGGSVKNKFKDNPEDRFGKYRVAKAKDGGQISKETQEMIESFEKDRTPKFDPKMFDQPESEGGDKKPKAVRPKAQPNQKREGEKPIAKPGKKPIAKRLPDKPITSILEKESIEFIGKNKKSKGGLIKGFPRLAKKGF